MGTQFRISIKLSVLLALAGSFLFPSLVRAQDERCSIVQGLGCIDFDPNTTTTLTVPANTTRIERDAVRVCVEGITDTEPVDVVFIVDQSGSMCNNGGTAPPCTDGADPTNVAPVAVNSGLDLLNTLASGSYATVLRFAQNVSLNGNCPDRNDNPTEDTPPIAPLSTNLTALQTWVTDNIPEPGNGCGGPYTNYNLALSTADNLVRQGPHADSNKVIIFITDGVPHDPDANPPRSTYDNWPDAEKEALVPVHSIYIGGNPAAEDCSDPENDQNPGGRLGCLAYLTGGSYNPIDDVDELEGVIEQIVNQVTQTANINQSVIANTTNGQSNTVTGPSHVEETQTRFIAPMSNVIALNEGPNTIQVTTSATIAGTQSTLSKTITINVEGTDDGTDTLFNLQCDAGSQIEAWDAGFNNPITSINFNATGFGVRLNSSDEGLNGSSSDNLRAVNSGDEETYGMTLADGAGQHTVTMSTGGAGPANGNMEVAPVGGDEIRITWTHPQDPRDIASYVLTVTDDRDAVDIVNVWITDQNGDGAGDMIFIQTDGVAPVLPTSINNIDWPGNGSNVKTATSNQISYLDSDSTIIVVDLRNDPFDVGATAPDGSPTLTMPDQGPYYTGTTHPIEDRIGAVITEVIKIPSNFTQIGIETMGDDGTLDTNFRTKPDTLEITISEPITGTGVDPWKDVLIYVDGNDTIAVDILVEPIVDPHGTGDSLTWRIIIPASRDNNALTIGDFVFLNPNSTYTDANGNTNGTGGKETGGEDGSGRGVITQVFPSVITSPNERGKETQPNLVLNTQIEVVKLNGDTTLTDLTSIKQWIPPHGFDPETGNVNPVVQQQCEANGTTLDHTCIDNCPTIEQGEIPLSRILVVTQVDEGPYKATINIFDHLGKYVRSLEQWWGFCGEASNNEANIPGGIKSFLTWNLKHENGKYVGSGVYVIKVTYHFPESGRVRNVLYKQGFALPDNLGL